MMKPNLIDLYNVETTNKLIPKSCRYILKTLITNYYSNKYLVKIYNNFDDVSLIISAITDYICLSKTDSTFISNNFNISYEFNDKFINKKDLILLTLFDNFGINYIETKLEAYKDDLLQNFKRLKKNYKQKLIENHGSFWEDSKEDFKAHVVSEINLKHYIFMFKYYPIIKRILKLFSIFFKLAYHKNYSQYYSVLQYIFDIKQTKSSIYNSFTSKIFLYLISLVKIVEYYNRNNFLSYILSSKDILLDQVPIPEPVYDQLSLQKLIKRGMCPICNSNHQNPTCCKDTGLVFCYDCIYDYLDNQRNKSLPLRCPVSNIELIHGFEGLIRLK